MNEDYFMRQIIIITSLIISNICHAQIPVVREFTIPAKTSVPYTYCIWYLPDPENESFLKELSASPPDLFHLGYQIPFKGGYGPAYGGELYIDDMLAPNEVGREIERIKRVINKMHAAGVERLIPYVYTMAFFGRPEERKGFFNFYDHWDDYRSYGLGPKPAADPSLWSQVRGPHQLGSGPKGVLHYDPCINHPGWVEYLNLVVRQIAAVNYDGMFFDVNTLYCYCPHCQEKFDIYLLNKYGKNGLREIFGTEDHRILNLSTIYKDFEEFILTNFKPYLNQIWDQENLGSVLGLKDTSGIMLENDWRLLRCYMQNSLAEYPPANNFTEYLNDQYGGNSASTVTVKKKNAFVQTVLRHYFNQYLESKELARLLKNRFGSSNIQQRCCATPRDLLLWVETQRFWCESMALQFERLKRVGRVQYAEQGRGDDFYTVANLGSMSTLDALNKRRVDAIDLVHWAPKVDMQMFEEVNQVGSLESGVIISNIFATRWAMAAGTRAGTLLYHVTDDRAADLAHAEIAAGGGGAFIQCGLSAPESRKRWKRFFSDHADLWDDGRSWAQVGVLFWSDQVFYENSEHLAMTHALVHILSESQIPFDMITEENIRGIYQYKVVIAPRLQYLNTTQIETLIDYVNQGGNLIIIEPFGTEDKYAKPRQTDPLANLCSVTNEFKCVPYGQGKFLRLESDHVPKRQSDLWCLMEERANEFISARNFLNNARQTDLEKGVDLGPKFIQKIEELLGLKLSWCPIETDAGVHIHAYLLPSKCGRPERLVVHAVNYRTPILVEEKGDKTEAVVTKSGKPLILKDIRIAVPLPSSANGKSVEVFSPTDQLNSVKWSIKGNRVIVIIDRLKIYQIVVIELIT